MIVSPSAVRRQIQARTPDAIYLLLGEDEIEKSALAHQFDPNAWTYYTPTYIEMGILIGSFGWFLIWFLLFVKVMPSVAIAEVKEQVRPPLKGLEAAAK